MLHQALDSPWCQVVAIDKTVFLFCLKGRCGVEGENVVEGIRNTCERAFQLLITTPEKAAAEPKFIPETRMVVLFKFTSAPKITTVLHLPELPASKMV